MRNLIVSRPAADEYFEYYGKYVALVEGTDILTALKNQLAKTQKLLGEISEEKAGFRYAPDKWSIKELLGHIIDSERIFAYRALRFARADKAELPGYEQDDYIRNADFDACRWADLTEEFVFVRQANLLMFQNFTADAWRRRGTASDHEISVRALAYIIGGHEIHHLNILQERY